MSYATFTTDWKNISLSCLLGKTSSFSVYALTVGIVGFVDSSNSLIGSNGHSIFIADFSPVNEGESLFVCPTFTPNGSGTVDHCSINYNVVKAVGGTCNGPASLTTGGGMFILPSLTLTNGTPFSFRGVIKVPKTNGGTLNIGRILANNWCLSAISTTATSNIMSMLTSGYTFSLYSGTQPASADTAVPGGSTLLAQITGAGLIPGDWSTPASGASSLIKTVSSSYVLANGTPTWGRWQCGLNTMDFSVGLSDADCVLDRETLATGSEFTIVGFSLYL